MSTARGCVCTGTWNGVPQPISALMSLEYCSPHHVLKSAVANLLTGTRSRSVFSAASTVGSFCQIRLSSTRLASFCQIGPFRFGSFRQIQCGPPLARLRSAKFDLASPSWLRYAKPNLPSRVCWWPSERLLLAFHALSKVFLVLLIIVLELSDNNWRSIETTLRCTNLTKVCDVSLCRLFVACDHLG